MVRNRVFRGTLPVLQSMPGALTFPLAPSSPTRGEEGGMWGGRSETMLAPSNGCTGRVHAQ